MFPFLKFFMQLLRGEIYSFYGGSGGGQSTNTIQNADPWVGQQGYLRDIFSNAQRQFNAPGPGFFPSTTVAAPSQATTQGQNYLTDYATRAATFNQGAMDSASFNLGPGRFAESNPYLQSYMEAAARPLVQGFQAPGGVLSSIRSNFNDSSGGQSTRQGIAEGVATRGLTQQIADQNAQIAFQGYSDAAQRATQSQALAPSLMQAGAYPGSLFSAVGQQQEQYTQNLINEAINRWNFEQNLPAQKLAQYQALVQGGYGGTSSSTSSATPGQVNPVLSAAGGAATGYALGTMIGGASQGATYGPWGAVAGGLIGLMMS